MTTTVLNTKISEVSDKIPDTSSLVATAVLNVKSSKVKNKVSGNSKYSVTEKFNKLTAENFAARLKQANLANKTDFDNKLTRFDKPITSNKTKHLEVQKKLNTPITKDYSFLLRQNCFTSNDQSQNTFVYQPMLDSLELKKGNSSDYALTWKSKKVFNSKIDIA